ncbi:MAG: amidohydrolase/deacetylase family metallohydrolase, partial [Chloroflexi bacterium]|nr:amidohydrolase/deacetylase family metallohydrolase [Chloroflexota bacterium]
MYDLVVTGGTVVDPAQRLNERLDVAITDGRVSEVGPLLDAGRAARELDATGMVVSPGLVDLHVHIYEGVSHYGINADEPVLRSGVTTAADAGPAGASALSGLPRYVIDVSDTRLFAFLNISGMGMISESVGELEEIRWADPAAAIKVCEANRDLILGIKRRISR